MSSWSPPARHRYIDRIPDRRVAGVLSLALSPLAPCAPRVQAVVVELCKMNRPTFAWSFERSQVYVVGVALLVLLAHSEEKSDIRRGDLHASLWRCCMDTVEVE